MFKKSIIGLVLLFIVTSVIIKCFGHHIFTMQGEVWASYFFPAFFATLILLELIINYAQKKRPSKTDRFCIPIVVMILFFSIIILCVIFSWFAVYGVIAATVIRTLILLAKRQLN
jgi:hypothetical protein